MTNTFNTPIVVVAILAFCAVIALVVVIVMVNVAKRKKAVPAAPAAEPLPGGGGSYTMHISGMNCEHCRANAEAALNAFEGITATVDLKTETANIRYEGYPDLTLLEKLSKAVEDAGFTVTEIV